jgi:rhomboid protease GluP
LSEEPRETFLDWAVGAVASAMDSLGWNGTRLRWRWNQRRRDLGEAGAKAANVVRATRVQYKMCPSCRALVPRSEWTCTECGAGLAGVRAPGLGRLISNVLPGATAVTGILMLVNGLMFLVVLIAPSQGGSPGVGRLLAGFDSATLIRFGAGWSYLTMAAGEWWRLVVPVFLHAGLLHFAFNSMALLQLGPLIEQEYGTERFAFLYLACGIAGNLASQWIRPVLTVGASGAIFGLIGVLLAHGIRRGGAFGGALRKEMLRVALWGALISFLPGIDLLCHAGGFAAGFLLGFVVPSGSFRNRATALAWEAIALAAVALALFAFYLMATQGEQGALLFQRLRYGS